MSENPLKVSFDDLPSLYRRTEAETRAVILRVAESGKYVLTQGQETLDFESAFAAYCESTSAIGVSSGTEALHLGLLALGVGPGDEVITQANTYIATLFAISYTGATPILVDIDPQTYTMDPVRLAGALTPRTRAVIPVHLYGHPADMDAIRSVIDGRAIAILEDAAQAHGARYHGHRVGSLGDAAAFSFYPTKNLGAMGDGGAVTTNREEVVRAIRRLRYMGQDQKYIHLQLGYQQRLDELQSAILKVRLAHLDTWNSERQWQAGRYNTLLDGLPVQTPVVRPGCEHVYYVYTIRVEAVLRDALRAHLAARGVETSVFYPMPLYRQPAYAGRWVATDFPETERAMAEILHLPVFPGYGDKELGYVAQCVKEFYERTA